MADSELQIDKLRKRLSDLLANWASEISSTMSALDEQQSLAETRLEQVQALEQQVRDLAELPQRLRERELTLDQLRRESKEKDVRFARLEQEHKQALARADELERKLATPAQPPQHQHSGQHAEFEAMRAELAARKSLVKSLRTDAARGKALEKEFAESREVIASMKESIERHARTIAELRQSADRWERKYRRLVEAGNKTASRDGDFSDSDTFTETVVEMFLDETMEGDGAHTIVIDMTEPLRKARDERRKKYEKR